MLLDGSESGPAFDLLLYVPNAAPRPVPAFLGLNFGGNHAVHPDPGIRLSTRVDAAKARASSGHRAIEAARGTNAASWPVERLLDRGYALATVYYGDIEPDHPDGWKDGVRARIGPGTTGRFAPTTGGRSRRLGLGTAAAPWTTSKTDPDVDGRRVAVIGHSRLGKTALWAGAQDERFAMVVSNDSGEGGAALAPAPLRRDDGEDHDRRSRIGSRPRPRSTRTARTTCPWTSTSCWRSSRRGRSTSRARREDLWADPRGEFLAARAAEPVYRLLGRDGLASRRCPSPDRPVGETIGYHLRTGTHALTAYDWEQYLDFADRHLGK